MKDLIAANNNRGKVAWIIFVTHRPMYCSDTMEESQHIVGAGTPFYLYWFLFICHLSFCFLLCFIF